MFDIQFTAKEEINLKAQDVTKDQSSHTS